jgi:hypothetical protein
LIILGVILVVLGLLLNLGILTTLGIIVVAVGVVLFLLGVVGRPIGGRQHWY